MSWYKVKLIFFLFFIIRANIGFAQQPTLDFSSLKALEPISNINATTIIQDSIGYLWIGTEQGLFRFDGQSIYNYPHGENEKNSLPPCRINRLFVDRKNVLWVCSSEGLYKYNREFDNFKPIVVEGDLKGIPGYNIDVIAMDNKGQIYLSYENTVYKFNREETQFAKVTKINQGRIHNFIFDQENNIWIASYFNGGLHYYNQENQQMTSYVNDPTNKHSISNNEVFDIDIVNGTLWIATYGGGIDSYNLKNKSFKHYISSNFSENSAMNILIDRKKDIWICTLGSLKLYDPSSDKFYNYYNDPENPKSLGKTLWNFYEDHQGNYWTVHNIGGIRVSLKKNKFNRIDTNPANFWHTSANNITAISFDSSKNLWIGNYFNVIGLDVLNFEKQRIDNFIHKENDPKSLGNGTIFSIFNDSKNQIWIGSNTGGLQRYNPETKDFITYKNNPKDTLSIAHSDVRSISEDKNGDFWLVLEGKGVDRFDLKTKTFQHFNAKNNHLSTDFGFQVFNDSKGNLWVATAWGLDFLRKGDSVFKYFTYNKNDSNSISSNVIHAIHEDALHNIWIGTLEGLNKFNPENQTFTRYYKGLNNKQVAGILSDQKNNIWISTKAGISKFDPNTNRFTNFDQGDGLLSAAFHNNSCCKDENNNLYFGGVDGIDFFNPDSLVAETKPPTVVLTDFKLFNKSIENENDRSIIQKHISYTKNIVLDYQSNAFTFLFQVINITHPEEITYSYRLDGFDKDWVYSGSKREANYSNLKPGEYTFRVKAKYDNGDWSKKETTIKVEIVPAWWMTIWFKILSILIILSSVFGLFYLRMKRLREQSEKLEILVAERTNEIQSKNELLKDLNSTKDKLFSIISHDLRSPFNAILGFQDLLINNYSEFSDSDRLNMIKQAQSTTNQTYFLVDNLLNWAKIQTNNILYYPMRIDLENVIIQKFELYQNIAEIKKISLNYYLPDKLIAFADNNLLETTLRNLINNAIKFTPTGGSINVTASKENNVINITVSDSGTGMTQEQIENLFNPEKIQTKSGTSGEKGSGLGLILCKEFVEKNKGTLSVESQLGKGSTFSFTIPGISQK